MNAVKQQLYTIRKWGWLLVLGLLIGAAAGFLTSSRKPVIFQASAKVMLSRAANDTGGVNAVYYQAQMVRSYAELANNQAVLENMNHILGYRVSEWQVSASPVSNTTVLWVNGRDDNPRRAAAIANAFVQAMNAYLVALQDAQFEAAENDLEQRIAAVEEQIAAVNKQIAAADEGAAETLELQTLQDTLVFHQQVYADLLDRQAGLRVEKLQSLVQASLLQAATTPATSIPRQRPQAAFTYALAGLAAAGALALAIEAIDDRIHIPEDVEQLLGLPVLGLAPGDQPGEPNMEASRLIYTNLDLAAVEAPIHTLLVTGPGTESTSAIAGGLAQASAQAGRRTILLDLWNGQEARLGEPGVPTVEFEMQSEAIEAAPIDLPAWGSPPLLVVARRAPGGAAVPLDAEALERMLSPLQEAGERVIIDAPGGLTGEALALAVHSDAALMVVFAGKTRLGPAQLLKEQLQRAGVRLTGAVVSAGRGWPYYSRYNELLRSYRVAK